MKLACLNENKILHEMKCVRVLPVSPDKLSGHKNISWPWKNMQFVFVLALILIVSGCTTGKFATKTYDDDIYFSPGDAVAEANLGIQDTEEPEQSAKQGDESMVISRLDTNQDGSQTQNNYIFENENQQTQFNMDNMELVGSDTTQYLNEDSIKYVINNYYEGNDLDFEYRINRFHRPFWFSPFLWNDWDFSPYYSWNYYGGWGYNPYWYGYDPYYSWYSPFYSWGWPYYAGSFYAENYWYNHGGGGYIGNRDSYYGRRESSYSTAADRRSESYSSTVSRTRGTDLKSGSSANRVELQERETYNHDVRASRSSMPQDVKNATIMDRRRNAEVNGSLYNSSTMRNSGHSVTNSIQTHPNTNRTSSPSLRTYNPSTTGQTYQRNSSTQQRSYVPSYNMPRTVTRSTYNSESYNKQGSNATYSSPRSGSGSNSRSQGNPSSVKNTYRSSSTYNQGSSTSSGQSSRSSYSSGSRSNSSYDSGRSSSYSSGGSSSGSYSSGSSSSGSSGSSSGGGERSGSSSGRR